MGSEFDVAVIGGGVIGRSVAFELVRRGVRRVAVIDHGRLGGEPSACAAGLLPLASMRSPRGILFDLARASLDLYPIFLERLAAATGTSLELTAAPCLQLAETEDAEEELRRRVSRRAASGFDAEFLEHDDLRRVPNLAQGFRSGALFRGEMQIEAPRLLTVLRDAVERRGVAWIEGRAGLDASRPGRLGIDVGGRWIDAERVVVAAGWWSTALVEALGATLPLRAARGEIVEVAAGKPPEVVIDHGALLIPRGGGRVWIGGLVEFDSHGAPTDRGRRALLDRAAAVWPEVAAARVLAQWAGVRPCSAIRHPIVDRLPGRADVYVATGHHRSGFLHAPLTAAIVAARLFGETLPVEERAVCWK